MKFRRGTHQVERARFCIRRPASIAAVGTSCLLLGACGITGGRVVNGSAALPEFFGHLNACLKAHGIAHPEASTSAADAERSIPALLGVAGIPVPDGVTNAQYEAALKRCGVTNVHVGRSPITSALVKGRIASIMSCLARNGYTLPAPNFIGSGPVVDTTRIDVGSARWRATAMGCSVTQDLTKAVLSKCMGDGVLAGRATGGLYEERVLALPSCLKKAALRYGPL